MTRRKLVTALVLTVSLAVPALAAGPLQIGSVAGVRFGSDWSLDGYRMQNTRAKLLNPANFGPSGTVKVPIQITDTAATVGSVDAVLLANYDLFFIGYLEDGHGNAFTADEIAAFQSWVARGGTMVVTCDDPADDAVCAAFGLPVSHESVTPAVPTAAGAAHPLFAGPFGVVAKLDMWGDFGYFASTIGATVLAEDSTPGGPLPVVASRQWGAGRVVVLGDVDILAVAASPGPGISTANDRFIGNLFAFLTRPYDLMIDATAHTVGLSGTSWRSDVDLLNIGDDETVVTVAQLKANQGNTTPVTAMASVPAGRTLRLTDVLDGMFTGTNAALGLSFQGGRIYANSRFYNVGSVDGSEYGMYVPSSDDADAVWFGHPAVFHHLSYTPGGKEGTRVNVGGASRAPFPVSVVIKLYGDNGELLGARTQTFQPYEHRQITNIHQTLGTPAVTHGYATVEILTRGGAVDMYAMLIENQSGDPIYMPPSPGTRAAGLPVARAGGGAVASTSSAAAPGVGALCLGPYDRVIAAAANTNGLNDSKWQTDVDLLNLGATGSTVEIARLTANQANTSPLITAVLVPPGTTMRLENILDQLLPATNAGLGFRFCSGSALVNSRFYNTGSGDGKVYGMYVPSQGPDSTVTPCRPGVFHHLSYSTDSATGQRINIGATNATAIRTTWVIKLYGDNGDLIGSYTATLAPFEHHQYTNIHKILGTPAVTHGWATVEVTTPGGAIFPYAMRIENLGGDPIYMPAELERMATSPDLAAAFAGHWAGQWKNTTASTKGNAALDLAFDLATQAVTATLDLDGRVFGGDDPPPQTFAGTFAPEGIVFTGSTPFIDSYQLTVSGACSLSGELRGLSNPDIESVSFDGTLTSSKAALAYQVHFTAAAGGGTANGTLTLAK